jgi:hypothetical protein
VVAAGAAVRHVREADGARRGRVPDESPGYAIVCSHGVEGCSGAGQSIAYVGGTSAAAPLVAGMIALWKQQTHAQGRPRPGFVVPALTPWWEFLSVAAPLRIERGTGSPFNPIAVF